MVLTKQAALSPSEGLGPLYCEDIYQSDSQSAYNHLSLSLLPSPTTTGLASTHRFAAKPPHIIMRTSSLVVAVAAMLPAVSAFIMSEYI